MKKQGWVKRGLKPAEGVLFEVTRKNVSDFGEDEAALEGNQRAVASFLQEP